SMQIGSPRSRWNDVLARIDEAQKLAGSSPAVVKPFRFGQRLAAIESTDLFDLAADNPGGGPRITPTSAKSSRANLPRPIGPTDGDTRLLTALRQISSRFGRVPPQGIVVFSDGRARDDAGLAQLAQEFSRLKVPIHAVPVGDTSKGGDVAVAAIVV